jgi:hypothetical protein
MRYGGAEGSRTPDLLIANEALYQLSYGPFLGARQIRAGQRDCQGERPGGEGGFALPASERLGYMRQRLETRVFG